MDLWQALARLRERPILLAAVVAVSALLGFLGWTSTSPSYSVSIAQVVQVRSAADQTRYSAGSFEVGMIAGMVTTNLNTVGTGVSSTTVTANNSVVAPPTMIPLITMTVTGQTPEETLQAAQAVAETNTRFMATILGVGNRDLALVQVNPTHPPVVSSQPRVRAGGSGVILGLLGGTLALLAFDTFARARAARQDLAEAGSPATADSSATARPATKKPR